MSKRAEKAQQTRLRMLEAAKELFVRQGYGATNLQQVADRAGVAVQTLYFTFGNKRAILKELVGGDEEPLAALNQPWFRDAVMAGTAEAQLREHVRGTGHVLERVAPLTQMVALAAAADAEVARLWPRDNALRYEVQLAAARALVSKPDARQGVSAKHAADVLFAMLSAELYLLLVRERGWSHAQWEDWAYETLHTQFCGADEFGRRGPSNRA